MTASSSRYRWAFVAGCVLFLCAWGLGQTMPGLHIAFVPDWTNSRPGELYFWLANLLFLTPAGWLWGYAASPWLVPRAGRVWTRLEAMTREEKRMGLFMLFAVQLGLARAMHIFIMRGFPFTDDEWSTRVGGQMLAMGHAMVPLPHGWKAMPDLYLFVRNGNYTSFDWVGSQAVWAFGFLTGTGTLAFSLLAALSTTAVAFVAAKRLGTAWGVVAALLFAFSPMGFAISASSHGQLISRGLIALVFALYLVASEDTRLRWWIAVGFVLGLSLIARPFETLFTLAPLALDVAFRAAKDANARRGILGVVIGMAAPVAMLLLHQHAVTGNALLPARWAHNEITPVGGVEHTRPVSATFTNLDVFWNRFGRNFSYNLFMLVIYALGAVGAALAVFGTSTDRFSRILGACVVSGLVLSLFHDNPGIHTAGPMHYQEALVPITLLSVYGLHRAVSELRENALFRPQFVVVLAAGFAVGMGTFDFWHGLHLRDQAAIHETAYGMLEAPNLAGKVVMAPRYAQVWSRWYFARQVGTFVFQWRPLSPFKDEATVIVHDVPEAIPGLREDYPNREIVRMRFNDEAGPGFTIEPVAPPSSPTP